MKAFGFFLQGCAAAGILAQSPLFAVESPPLSSVALEATIVSKPILQFNYDTKMLIISIDHAQQLSISAFVMTGKKVSKLSCEKFLTAGTHRISFNNQKLSNGVVIFKVEGSGFTASKTINLMR
jgi:hypothetical protein